MNKLKSIFVNNRYFFSSFLFFFLVGLVFLLVKGKSATFFSLNPYHRTALDIFFINFTYLGDGLFSVAVIIILLVMRRLSQACQVLISFLVSALLAQLMKNLFSMPRPKEFFSPGQYTYFIDGITNRGFSSFPSGHTTSVFALATMLALFEKNKKWNILYLLVAVGVGYSRIYLGQHFLSDVLAGSLIGMLLSVLVHWLFPEKFRSLRGFA